MVRWVSHAVPTGNFALHFHDTTGRALDNVLACLDLGIRTIDCAVGGLGGCPSVPGRNANLSTERMIRALHCRGIETGVDVDALVHIDRWIGRELRHRTT